MSQILLKLDSESPNDIEDVVELRMRNYLSDYKRDDGKKEFMFAVDCTDRYTPLPSEEDLEKKYQHKYFDEWYEKFVSDFTEFALLDICKKNGWTVYIVDASDSYLGNTQSEIYRRKIENGAKIFTLAYFEIYAEEMVRRFKEAGYTAVIGSIDGVRYKIKAIIISKQAVGLKYYA